MNSDLVHQQTISIYHLKQQELVEFLYDRFSLGMVLTLIVALVATILAVIELSLQGLEFWAYLWFAGMLIIQAFRYHLKLQYDRSHATDYRSHHYWKRRFAIGVYAIALWQGVGMVAVIPWISSNLQFIFHFFLLGLGAGAIAYLATSMMIFTGYLALMILPVTLYLFWL